MDIQFTKEEENALEIPFFNALVSRQLGRLLMSSVNRKKFSTRIFSCNLNSIIWPCIKSVASQPCSSELALITVFKLPRKRVKVDNDLFDTNGYPTGFIHPHATHIMLHDDRTDVEMRFLDISEAFDVVNHRFLCAKLANLRISPLVVDWINS